MKELIIKKALELGFTAIGFTGVDPVDESSHLVGAIDQGRTANMSWLARNPAARCDPKSLFPNAKTVICLAYPFGEEGIVDSSAPSKDVDRRRARYSRGMHYHEFIRDKLEELWKFIEGLFPESHSKLCVDTSPILEKALAERSGIGWIGKHTILVNEKFGSWFMLGEIITDIEIEPDTKSKNRCGECTRCIDACPTRALISANKLKADRCISFHTTMSKEEVPSDMLEFIPEGTFGCDICQEVCPFNSEG